MNVEELQAITMADWLISLWPIYMILIGVLVGVITRIVRPKPKSRR